MLFEELQFIGRESYFRATKQFITLLEVRILEEINGRTKNATLKKVNLP